MIIKESTDLLLPKSLQDLKQTQQKELIIKSLFALAILATGIAITALFGLKFIAYGVTLIITSSLAIYHYKRHYYYMKNLYSRAAAAIHESCNSHLDKNQKKL